MKTRLLKITLLLIGIMFMMSCDPEICKEYDGEPEGLLKKINNSDSSATQMQDNYLKKRYSKSPDHKDLTLVRDQSDSKGELEIGDIKLDDEELEDAVDVVFTLGNLSHYICYIQGKFEILKELEKYKDYKTNELGVRIYFGAKEVSQTTERNVSMETTVFLVPVVRTNPDIEPEIYLDIREIAPLNFGHARRPPKLYEGYIKIQ